jgi:hypothetical protein
MSSDLSCSDLEEELCKLEIMLKQSPEDYFRKSITVPFLYCMLNEMKTRFTDLHARTALGLQLVRKPLVVELFSICSAV